MAGLALYSDDNIFLLGYLDSVVEIIVLNIMNPTINYPPALWEDSNVNQGKTNAFG